MLVTHLHPFLLMLNHHVGYSNCTYVHIVICHAHFLQVLLLGLHELENPKNIERLKKDLKVREFFK